MPFAADGYHLVHFVSILIQALRWFLALQYLCMMDSLLSDPRSVRMVADLKVWT